MKVRIQVARYSGKWYVKIGLTSAQVEEGKNQSAPRIVLKPRHLKLLGIQRYRREDYFLLNGRTLAHGKRHLGFVVLGDLPLPALPTHREDFAWERYLECKPLPEKQGGGA